MIKINLVPKDILDREVQKQRVLQASIVAGLVVLVVIGISTLHIYRANRFESNLAELQKEYEKLAKVVAQVEELERTANAVKTRLTVITGLLKGRPLYPFFMTDFVSAMPAGAWITNLATLTKDGAAQLTVTITAVAGSSDGVSQWLRNLEQSGKFSAVKLSGAITITDKEGVNEHKFSVTAEYKMPGL